MKKKSFSKLFVISSLFVLLLLICINHRTPFFTPKINHWSIGYKFLDHFPQNLNIENGNLISPEKLKELYNNVGIIADPFFIKEKDTTYLFFEFKTDRPEADIALMKSYKDNEFVFDRVILSEDFHLSYPYVFKYKDTHFMIPETKRAKKVLLYKSYNFPYDWRIEDTLLNNINLKDSSIFLSDSLNFLVASDDNYSLYLFESDSLRGEWKKHKKRSLMRFGTEARPAGRIFINKKNKITIPIQNCSHGYGYGLSLYEINFDKYGNYDFEIKSKYFLKANNQVKEFAGGMHHLDIQKIDDKYLVFYDGYGNIQDEYNFNWKFPIKLSYIDTKNYFYQVFN